MSEILTDPRDGQTYKTVSLNGNIWMAENMKFQADNSWTYDDDPANGEKYGRLYTWEAAKLACPEGWVLPTAEDYENLIQAFKNLNLKPHKYLIDGGGSGFNAQLCGFRTLGGTYGYLDAGVGYWSATESSKDHAYNWYFFGNPSPRVERESNFVSTGFSVRYRKAT